MTTSKRNNSLSKELMEKIKSISCGVFSINKNESIFNEGDHTDYIYFIENGDIVLKKNKDNHKISFLELLQGELIGIDCVYNDGYCNYSATAATNTKGTKILISDFKTLIAEHKKASLELMRYLSSIVNSLETNI